MTSKPDSTHFNLDHNIVGHLDNPTETSIQAGKINRFSGWVFFSNNSVIKKVEVYHNEVLLGSCKYGIRRDDVLNDYHVSQSQYSGFIGDIHIPHTTSSRLSIVVHDDHDKRYKAFTINLTQSMLNESILSGELDLAKLEPVLLVDAIYRSMAKNLDGTQSEDKHIPSMPSRNIVAGTNSIWSFGFVGGQSVACLKILCDLKQTDQVLDIGCGCGRSAISLRGKIQSYTGFDVKIGLVDQAKSLVRDPNFKFFCYDLYSHSYNRNKTAVQPELFTFPFEDNSFDLTIAMSVFTHLLPAALKNYVKQVARVLRPNGRCFFTFFLKQNNPHDLGDNNTIWNVKFDSSKSHVIKTEPDSKFFSIAYPKDPDAMVIYDLDYVNEIFKNNGLTLMRKPLYGKWNGYPEGLLFQDVLMYTKSK